MLISAPKFAESYGLTKQRIYQFISRGDLVLTAKKIDTDHPVNKTWIESRKNAPPHVKPPGRYAQRDGYVPPIKPPSPLDPSAEIDAEEVLAHMSTLDIRRYSKVDIDKLKNLEGMLKIRVERQHKRRELIERSLVQTVFGRLYQIDSNELRVLGARLAPEVSGILGIDDPEKVLAVEQCIDAEVLKVMAHIQRLLHDSLVAWGVEGGLGQ